MQSSTTICSVVSSLQQLHSISVSVVVFQYLTVSPILSKLYENWETQVETFLYNIDTHEQQKRIYILFVQKTQKNTHRPYTIRIVSMTSYASLMDKAVGHTTRHDVTPRTQRHKSSFLFPFITFRNGNNLFVYFIILRQEITVTRIHLDL